MLRVTPRIISIGNKKKIKQKQKNQRWNIKLSKKHNKIKINDCMNKTMPFVLKAFAGNYIMMAGRRIAYKNH